MPKTQFLKEHKALVGVLRHGTKADRLAEAADQEAEVKQYTGKGYGRDTANEALTMLLNELAEAGIRLTEQHRDLVFDALLEAAQSVPQEGVFRRRDKALVRHRVFQTAVGALDRLRTFYGKTPPTSPTAPWPDEKKATEKENRLRKFKEAIEKGKQGLVEMDGRWVPKAEKDERDAYVHNLVETLGSILKGGKGGIPAGPGVVGEAVSKLIGSEVAGNIQEQKIAGTQRMTYNGHEYYTDPNEEPPGARWRQSDLTLQALKAYGMMWNVVVKFPDGRLERFAAPASKKGLASKDIAETAATNAINAYIAQHGFWLPPEEARVLREEIKAKHDAAVAYELEQRVKAEEARQAEVNARWAAQLQENQDMLNQTGKYAPPPPANAREAFIQKYGISPEDLQATLNEAGPGNNAPLYNYAGPTQDVDTLYNEMKALLAESTGSGRTQFSTPVRKVLEEISFGPPNVLGSSGDEKSMYSADYDLLEYVPYNGVRTVKAFQRKIATLASKYCITDIKCGEKPEWNVMTAKTYNRKKELEHLGRLWQEKVITDAEHKHGQTLLKEHHTKAEHLAFRKELRFGIWRWTPEDVARGYIHDRQKKVVRLEDAMKSPGITKVDFVVWVRDKYVEVSNIILWTRKNGKPYAKLPSVLESLREDIVLKLAEGKYFKAAKRMLSVARNRRDVAAQEKLYSIVNSHLGHMATVISDLQVLKEFPDCVSKEKKRKELDGLRDDMAKLYYPEFLKTKDPQRLLPALERKLNEEAKKKLEELFFIPVRGDYKE